MSSAASPGQWARYLRELEHGTSYGFADWPNAAVPDVCAGVYTIWAGARLMYVGMAGRALTAERIGELRETGDRRSGLWTRLASHASGRRSGDQFCVYVADRLVLPGLSAEQVQRIADGELSMDRLVREFVREQLGYRFVQSESGRAALTLEQAVQSGALSAGPPLLNPRSRNE